MQRAPRAAVVAWCGAFHIMACLVFGSGCGAAVPTVNPPRAATPGAMQLVIMTFNVHRDESGDRSTVDAVGAPDADIVCLQEPTAAWERVLRNRYASQYPYMIFKTDAAAGGLAVLSRFPLEDAAIMFMSDWHPALRVIAETPAGPLQILDVHLRARFDGDHDVVSNFFEMDNDHEREIARFTDGLFAHVPTVVLGDFNEDTGGPALRFLDALGFENALPMFRPGRDTWRGRSILSSFGMSLDHIVFTRPLVPLDAQIASPGRSDHFPVLVRFEIKQPWQQVPIAKR